MHPPGLFAMESQHVAEPSGASARAPAQSTRLAGTSCWPPCTECGLEDTSLCFGFAWARDAEFQDRLIQRLPRHSEVSWNSISKALSHPCSCSPLPTRGATHSARSPALLKGARSRGKSSLCCKRLHCLQDGAFGIIPLVLAIVRIGGEGSIFFSVPNY